MQVVMEPTITSERALNSVLVQYTLVRSPIWSIAILNFNSFSVNIELKVLMKITMTQQKKNTGP